MENGSAPPKTSAAVLDALLVWVLRELTEYPIRTESVDDRFMRATVVAENEALKAYRATRSFDSALAAGKRAFQEDFASSPQLVGFPTHASPSRATPDLWLETRGGATA